MVGCDGESGEVGRLRGRAMGWVVKRGVYVSGMGMVGTPRGVYVGRYGVLSPQLRVSSREIKRRLWRALSSPWDLSLRHVSAALFTQSFPHRVFSLIFLLLTTT